MQAPYYLVLSAKDHPFAAVNAGYVMEQLVLYLVSKALLSIVILEYRKSKPDLDQYQPMIVVAFGKAAATAVKKPASRQKNNRACESAAGSAAKCPKDYRGSKDCAICIQSSALAFYDAGWKKFISL